MAQSVFTKLKNRTPQWLGGSRLSAAQNAEAISLAALKGVEVLAHIVEKQNGLMKPDFMAAQFRFAAVQTSQQAKAHPEGSIERNGLEFMAGQLSDIAENILENEKDKKSDESKNQN